MLENDKPFADYAYSVNNSQKALGQRFAPFNGNQDRLGRFWIPRRHSSRIQILDFEFFVSGTWILDSNS